VISLVVLEPKQPNASRVDALRALKKKLTVSGAEATDYRMPFCAYRKGLHMNVLSVAVSPETQVPAIAASSALP